MLGLVRMVVVMVVVGMVMIVGMVIIVVVMMPPIVTDIGDPWLGVGRAAACLAHGQMTSTSLI